MAGNPNNRWGTRSTEPRREAAQVRPETRFSPPPPPQIIGEEPVYASPARSLPSRFEAGQAGPAAARPANPLLKPKVLIPALLVVLVLGAAMGFTPGSGKAGQDTLLAMAGSPTVASQASVAATTPAASQTAKANITPVPANLTVNAVATKNALTPQDASIAANPNATNTNDVAGVQSTPTVGITYAPTSCGTLKETATTISVEQAVNGVSVRATQAAVYPIDYLSCIMVATGTKDSLAIAQSLDKASRDGATHGVVIDLWVTNSNKEFGQVNLKSALVHAAGQVFSPLATLNGRAEVVVTGGQGRSVSLVVAMTNTITDTTGPMTLQIDAPIVAGKQMQGKYTLFLPTP